MEDTEEDEKNEEEDGQETYRERQRETSGKKKAAAGREREMIDKVSWLKEGKREGGR